MYPAYDEVYDGYNNPRLKLSSNLKVWLPLIDQTVAQNNSLTFIYGSYCGDILPCIGHTTFENFIEELNTRKKAYGKQFKTLGMQLEDF